MGRSRRRPRRRRVGRVSVYPHHGSWWVYYVEAGAKVRKKVAADEETAAIVAAEVNAQLTSKAPSLVSFRPTSVAELQRAYLAHHEFVLRSSLATVNRYRTATRHLVAFSEGRHEAAHELRTADFARYLRTIRVAPNGHPNAAKRLLLEKGVRFILESCRAMYGFAARSRMLPPYAENPFAGLGGKRASFEDAKPVFVFDQESELAFLRAADSWSFPIHLLLAKTGIRPGELTTLLVDDVDLAARWIRIRNKGELGWRIKTRRERDIPIPAEVADVLARLVEGRRGGPVFLRRGVDRATAPLCDLPFRKLCAIATQRVAEAQTARHASWSRAEAAKVYRTVWRDAGGVRASSIRQSFIQTTRACDLPEATCPKSWRHTFATLLQDANVDPLVRQLVLGHAPTMGPGSALGMTAVYTHTRASTLRQEVERALRLWPRSLELVHDSF